MLTAHVVVEPSADRQRLLEALTNQLIGQFGLTHTTLQLEEEPCGDMLGTEDHAHEHLALHDHRRRDDSGYHGHNRMREFGQQAPFLWSEGWREATVDAIIPGDQLKPAARRDCRENLAPEVSASRKFVRVRYRIRRVWHAVIAPMPPSCRYGPGRPCM